MLNGAFRKLERASRRLLPGLAGEPITIGVIPELAVLEAKSGHGRVWSTGVEMLGRAASVVKTGPESANRPDVWLCNGHASPPIVPEPVVSLVHEARWVEPALAADLKPSFLSRIAQQTADSTLRAARVIAPSFAAARNIAQLGKSADLIDVVPYGVDLDIFQPGLAGGRELVAAVMGDNKPYVISVATLFRGKNLPMLRDAVARLQARGFPHRLVLVTGPPGDGSDREAALAELRPGREFVALFEKVEEHDLAALLAGACAFCLPSRFEGFGIPALEALACGVPTIVSGGGALPEVVVDAGLVIEPTVQAIEDALAAVLADEALARRMALIGRRRAERFPWTATAEGWKRACERAIAAH